MLSAQMKNLPQPPSLKDCPALQRFRGREREKRGPKQQSSTYSNHYNPLLLPLQRPTPITITPYYNHYNDLLLSIQPLLQPLQPQPSIWRYITINSLVNEILGVLHVLLMCEFYRTQDQSLFCHVSHSLTHPLLLIYIEALN